MKLLPIIVCVLDEETMQRDFRAVGDNYGNDIDTDYLVDPRGLGGIPANLALAVNKRYLTEEVIPSEIDIIVRHKLRHIFMDLVLNALDGKDPYNYNPCPVFITNTAMREAIAGPFDMDKWHNVDPENKVTHLIVAELEFSFQNLMNGRLDFFTWVGQMAQKYDLVYFNFFSNPIIKGLYSYINSRGGEDFIVDLARSETLRLKALNENKTRLKIS